MDEGLTLEAQWSLWEAGIVPEVPSYVPRSWEAPPPSASAGASPARYATTSTALAFVGQGPG